MVLVCVDVLIFIVFWATISRRYKTRGEAPSIQYKLSTRKASKQQLLLSKKDMIGGLVAKQAVGGSQLMKAIVAAANDGNLLFSVGAPIEAMIDFVWRTGTIVKVYSDGHHVRNIKVFYKLN
jgi:hypothetical protein